MKKTDVVIIGAGIAGIMTAIYLKRAGVDFVILEGKIPGGKLSLISKIENFPGRTSISGVELQLDLLNQLKHLDISITYGMVQTILKNPDGFEVVTDIDSFACKAVVVASGSNLISGEIKGESKYVGQGVSYCATCDGNFFKGLDVAVYGNNNIALEEALHLSNLAKTVYLIVNNETLDGDPKLIQTVLNTKKILIKLSTKLIEVKGDDFGVSSILTNKNEEIPISGLLPYSGYKTSSQFLSNLNVVNENGYIVADKAMMSNVPGLFVVGDIVNKKVRQLVNACGEAAVASHYIISYLKGLSK